MYKYWLFARYGMQELLMYRLNFFSWFFVELLSALMVVYIWLSVYAQGGAIAGYSLRQIVLYYVLSRVVGMVVITDDLTYRVSDDILTGKLINNILKPINYFKSVYSRNFGQVIISLIYCIPISIPIFYLFHQEVNIALSNLPLFFFSIILALTLHFIFMYTVGLLAFFSQNTQGYMYLAWTFESLLSGRMIPLDIMPTWLYNLTDALPFKYSLFVPMQIITNRVSTLDTIQTLLGGCLWLVVISILSIWIYRKGIKKYDGYGI